MFQHVRTRTCNNEMGKSATSAVQPPSQHCEELSPHDLLHGAGKQPARLTLTFVLPALGAGGSEHVVAMLCNHFAAQGHRVRLLCFEPVGTQPFYALNSSVTLVCMDVQSQRRNPASSALAMLRRYRLLHAEFRRNRPDAVIAFLTRTNVLAAFAARSLDIPVIVSERNNPERQRVGRVWEWLRRHAYARTDALVTMTRGAGAYFAPASRRLDMVIPNHASPPDREYTFNPTGRHVVAVGRLVEQKGFDLLLDAFAALSPRFPDWRLTIWGEGPLRAPLEAQRSALGLEGRVSLPGTTSRPGDWTMDADIFVLSSRFEGWGLVVSEALAAGIPTVAFNCPWGPGEMISHGETGLLVPDQNTAALSAALARAMADAPLRERLGAAGRLSMQRYDVAIILGEWEALIRKVAGVQHRSSQARLQ